jgi:hypothetical protein
VQFLYRARGVSDADFSRPAKKPVMLVVAEPHKHEERKNMTNGTIVRCMAVVAGVLLASVASVYADHAATGKGTYTVPRLVLAEFHFVVAKSNPPLEPGLNFVQSEMAGRDGSRSFQTFMVSTAIAPLTISDDPPGPERMVTITGEMVSTTFLRVGSERQHFAELVSFTATGVDARTPEAGADLFSLEVKYSADEKQGPLFESLGFGTCDTVTCTITFEGSVKTGDIFVHTAGGG